MFPALKNSAVTLSQISLLWKQVRSKFSISTIPVLSHSFHSLRIFLQCSLFRFYVSIWKHTLSYSRDTFTERKFHLRLDPPENISNIDGKNGFWIEVIICCFLLLSDLHIFPSFLFSCILPIPTFVNALLLAKASGKPNSL